MSALCPHRSVPWSLLSVPYCAQKSGNVNENGAGELPKLVAICSCVRILRGCGMESYQIVDLDVVGSNPITRPNDRWNPEAAALRARKAEGGIVSGTAICPVSIAQAQILLVPPDQPGTYWSQRLGCGDFDGESLARPRTSSCPVGRWRNSTQRVSAPHGKRPLFERIVAMGLVAVAVRSASSPRYGQT